MAMKTENNMSMINSFLFPPSMNAPEKKADIYSAPGLQSVSQKVARMLNTLPADARMLIGLPVRENNMAVKPITSEPGNITLEKLHQDALIRAVGYGKLKNTHQKGEVLLCGLSAKSQKNDNVGDDGINSYADLWAAVAKAIGSIKTNYVDFYAGLMSKYAQMYQDYNSEVQTAATSAVTAGSDANQVIFYSSTMQGGYDNFRHWKTDSFGTVPDWGSMSADQKDAVKKSLAPAFTIDDNGSVHADLSFYTKAQTYPNPKADDDYTDGKAQVATPEYNAWLADFNTVGSTIQSNMQSFAQRYSQANSTFDNLNKELSGVISSLSQNAQGFLRS
ncbi:IpaD/SipD/SspD family type III secretion system needle tip protein [Enterobacter sp. 22466]|uniref:IpaD/SipD/SspD family type III secretion system needle tip protein n=1 Tax=Enterobacter sp. 22466 TaxID=3453924 RepID=UPI003F836CC1